MPMLLLVIRQLYDCEKNVLLKCINLYQCILHYFDTFSAFLLVNILTRISTKAYCILK